MQISRLVIEHHQLPQVVEPAEPVERVTTVALVTANELQLAQQVPDRPRSPKCACATS